MKMRTQHATGRASNSALLLLLLAPAAMIAFSSRAHAQLQPSERPLEARPAEPRAAEVRRTFFLSNVIELNDLNSIEADLQHLLSPRVKFYAVASQNAISASGTEEDVQLAQRIISELDRPKKVYRVTFTITDIDNGKPAGLQHVSVMALPGEKSELRQVTRVPVVIGVGVVSKGNPEGLVPETTYEDAGLKIEVSIEGAGLRAKVEESSVAPEKSGIGPQDPLFRSTSIEGMVILPLAKPVLLGSLDIPGSTRREEIEVVAEAVQ